MRRFKSIRRILVTGAAGAMMLPAVAFAAGADDDEYTRADMDREYQEWRQEQIERLDREYQTWSSEQWENVTAETTPGQSGAGMTTGSPQGRVTGDNPASD